MGLRRATEFMQRSGGLNTVLDPERLQQGTRENGYEVEFAQAVNISLDERGLPSLRNGFLEAVDGIFHSLFCKGGECLVIQERAEDAALMRINVDYSLTGVRSGLTKNLRMAWDQSGGDIFYSNGAQTGYVRSGVSSAWPVNTYQGATADLQFVTSIPLANHIAFQQGGKVLLAVGNAIILNHEPFHYGLFELSHGNVAAFESDVTLLAAVKGGFFAADGSRTWFFRQLEGWYRYKQEQVEVAPALVGSLAHDPVVLREVGFEADGFGRIWASTKGVCIGMDDGAFLNLTQAKIKYPAGHSYGSCLVKDHTVIHTAS